MRRVLMREGLRKYVILSVTLLVILTAVSVHAASIEKSVPQKLKKLSKGIMPPIDIKAPQYIAPDISVVGAGDTYVVAKNRHTGEIKKFYGAYYYYGWDDDWEILYRGKGMVPSVPGIGWKPLLRK